MRTAGIVLGLLAFAAGCGSGPVPQSNVDGAGGKEGSGGASGQGGSSGSTSASGGTGDAGGVGDGPCPEGAEREGESACGLNARGVLMQLCQKGEWQDTSYCVDADECVDEAEEWGGECSEGMQALHRCRAGAWEQDCVEGWTMTAGSSANDVVFGGDVDLDGGSLVVGYTTGDLAGMNAGYDDAFLMKIDGAGNVSWASQWGTTAPDAAYGVVAKDSAIFVVGYTSSDLGGQDSGGAADAYLRKVDQDGEELWTRQWGTAGVEAAFDVFASGGDVFVLGRTEGELGQGTSGGSDAWLSKVDAETGAIAWTAQWGTSRYDDAARGAADSHGNAVVVGLTEGQLGSDKKQGLGDAYVRKLKGESGDELWTVQFGTGAQDGALDVAVDEHDDVLVVGYTGGVIGTKSQGALDVFVLKLDGEDGRVLFSTQWGSDADDRPGAFSLAKSGNLYVAGDTSGTLRGTSAGQKDAFLTKLDPDGQVLWTEQWGTEGNDTSLGLGFAADEGVFVVGSTDGAMAGEGAGAFDAFVKRFYAH
jgi:hypothetical protein